ncbi:3',5'-cyclic adenosine monophosphate phosphodiesterase CpdA [Saccharospirillum salsuginis]|uniref:3',5'-cyclic adenosine monophosphate phosphodiesterase CpdA n=1 Tax=Saccharospirillum salsuginis TaxID=418750 RepID=A0A918KVD8_9GAMM|nr:3',5'-cyclic adenosine monophosphate phosphodiesterase CpdA [Saccharospirillum salsuginis]
MLGMNTQYSLDLILERIEAERDRIDLILATGDIAQDGSVEAYQRFIHDVDRFKAPIRWTAGNHDDRANMKAALSNGRTSIDRPVYTSDDWVVILLDSTVPGKVYGNLGPDQLALLDRLLTQHADKHALVTFHHHPLDMGSTWMDKIGIKNKDALHRVLKRHTNVRVVLWGHVHQNSDQMIDGVRYISTPSTCVQFEPGTHDFSIDHQGPGYRWLDLNADGTIDTGLTRIEGVDFEIDYSVKGY